MARIIGKNMELRLHGDELSDLLEQFVEEKFSYSGLIKNVDVLEDLDRGEWVFTFEMEVNE